MPKFSKTSLARLETCHKDLQIVFMNVINFVDCKIVFGHRTPEQQFKLYQKGREKIAGIWRIKNNLEVVTNCDGYDKLSEHNYDPSKAVDVVRYPIDWKDRERQTLFIGFVLGIARMLYQRGKIKHMIGTGIDWNSNFEIADTKFYDSPHFFIIEQEN